MCYDCKARQELLRDCPPLFPSDFDGLCPRHTEDALIRKLERQKVEIENEIFKLKARRALKRQQPNIGFGGTDPRIARGEAY